MDNLNDLFIILTSDNVTIKAERRISNIIEYFKTNSSNFEKLESIKFERINSTQFQKIIKFCEIIDYTPIVLIESLYNPQNEIDKFSPSLKEFYNNLSELEINEFMEISNDLIIPSLEDLCMMKINDSFQFSKQISFNKDELVNQLMTECDEEFTSEELEDMKAAIELSENKEFMKMMKFQN